MIRRKNLVPLILAVALLAGCSSPLPAPTVPPPIPSAKAATLIVPASETPAIPTATQSPRTPEQTSTPAEAIWAPLPAPLYDPNTLPGASRPYLSSLGQLAFIQDGVLIIETSPGSGEFQEIDRYTTSLRWSPDGMKLLYDASQVPQAPRIEAVAEFNEYRIWYADRTVTQSLASLIPDFPQPPYLNGAWIPRSPSGPAPFRNDWITYDWQGSTTSWSLDSTKILFVNIVQPDRLTTSFPGADTVTIADLESGEFRLAAEANLISAVYPVENRNFLLQDHCGTECEWLSGYNHLGELVWQLPWVSGGFFDVSSDHTFLVNAGRIAFYDPTDTNTVDEVSLLTGEFREIWRLSPDEFFPTPSVVYRTHLSPDDRYISFNILIQEQPHLQVIDHIGNGYFKIPNALHFEWDPAGGVIALQPGLDQQPGSVQLDLWRLPSGERETLLGPVYESFYEADWSPDSHYLALCSYDGASQQQIVRLWDRQANQILDVQSALAAEASLCNFAWIPDSNLVYYRLTRVEPEGILSRLYAYDVRSDKPYEIIAPITKP